MVTDVIGWASALLLLLTVSSQVWKQWQTRTSAGVSKWLFIGQISASAGFVVYSYLVDNMVFVATNSFLLLTAMFGQCLYLRNKRADRSKAEKAGA
jgi:MtN3 and saliva related transmembrane protein